MKQKNCKQTENLILIIPFLCITVFFFVLSFLYPKYTLSLTENRMLAQPPVLSRQTIASFPGDFEKYFNDQFPGREKFLKLFSRLQLVSGKIKVRNLYIVNGFLLPQEYLYSDSDLAVSAEKTGALMRYIASVGKKGCYVSLPYKTSVYNDMLPAYIQNNFGELNYMNFVGRLDPGIKTCDAFRCYQGRDSLEQYFFKTDLHWNAKGAAVAYQYILQWLYEEKFIDSPVHSKLNFDFAYIEDTPYMGDLNRRFSYLFSTHETIPVFNSGEKPVQYYLSYDSDQYTLDKDEITDQSLNDGSENYNSVYTLNRGYYKMVSRDALLDTGVLVIKDSMQDAMTEMFSSVFQTTEVVDIRYLEDTALSQIIKDSEAGLVLLMYHQNNVTGDMFDFGIE